MIYDLEYDGMKIVYDSETQLVKFVGLIIPDYRYDDFRDYRWCDCFTAVYNGSSLSINVWHPWHSFLGLWELIANKV
jgi:hypothetical protein